MAFPTWVGSVWIRVIAAASWIETCLGHVPTWRWITRWSQPLVTNVFLSNGIVYKYTLYLSFKRQSLRCCFVLRFTNRLCIPASSRSCLKPNSIYFAGIALGFTISKMPHSIAFMFPLLSKMVAGFPPPFSI